MDRRKCVQVTVVVFVFLISIGLRAAEPASRYEPQTITGSRLADTEPTSTPGPNGAGGGGHFGG